jgi:hypothetical protein
MLTAQRYGYPHYMVSLVMARAQHETVTNAKLVQIEELNRSMRECSRSLERLKASMLELEAAKLQLKMSYFAQKKA